jgi:hypothetical protein
MDKLKLMKDIHDVYECTYWILEDGKVEDDRTDNEDNVYNSVDDCLKAWLDILKETNKSVYDDGFADDLYSTWSKEEIEFIESL